MKKRIKLNLHLFEGEGTGATAGPAAGDAGEASDLSNVVYGKTTEDAKDNQTADKKAAFDELTKGEYKKEFNERMQNAIKERLAAERKSQASKQQPLLSLLAQKYGVDSKSDNFFESLTNAIQEDDSFFEHEAMEKGMSVDQLRQMKRLELQNNQFKEMIERQENEEKVNALMREAETLKDIYPGFDFEEEMQNDDLMRLLKSNIDLKTAFEVVHHDEIMENAMRYTANEIQKKTVNNIMARGMRPAENGTSSKSSATYKRNVADFTDEDVNEIIRRVGNGEKISL